MKAEITRDGKLILCPQTDLEEYAIEQYLDDLVNGDYREFRTPEKIIEKIIIEKPVQCSSRNSGNHA